jgi:hypothetical protein
MQVMTSLKQVNPEDPIQADCHLGSMKPNKDTESINVPRN